jgi:hypothetical protein
MTVKTKVKPDSRKDTDYELSISEWNELLSGGWIERTGYKTARPRRVVVAWVRGGDLWLALLAYMPCATADWFLIWLFRLGLISAAEVGEDSNSRMERVLRRQENELQWEAAI